MPIRKCDKEKWESTYLLSCLPDANEEIFCMSLPKCVLPFLTNQVAQFISCGDIGCFYFSGNTLLLPFLLPSWFQDSSQIKTREVPFHVLALLCLLLTFSRTRSIFLLNVQSHFLDLDGRILNLVYSYLKIQRKDQNLGRHSVSFITPLSRYQPIIQFN